MVEIWVVLLGNSTVKLFGQQKHTRIKAVSNSSGNGKKKYDIIW